MKVEPEGFARQVNYLAAIGRLLVPRAFDFVESSILFVGYGPFNPEELGGLLPERVEWYEFNNMPEEFIPDTVILGREGLEKGIVKLTLTKCEDWPKIIPQEGFLDELLFGHDWWDNEVESLRTLVDYHRGLQSARSLGALAVVGIEPPQSKKKPPVKKDIPKVKLRTVSPTSPFSKFLWPSTEAKEARTAGSSELDLDLQPQSKLKQLGYDTTRSRSERWRILTTRAIPVLGLPKVVSFIAWLCRTRKSQKGGRQKFASSIAEWENDLARLKKEVYPGYKPRFNWPDSEPKSK